MPPRYIIAHSPDARVFFASMPALRTRETHPAARPLEVVVTSAPPPALAIIAPTPRTFTFPAVHNLGDSPYSSPSTSPFEDPSSALSSLASTPVSLTRDDSERRRTPPPLSAFTRTLWPDSSSFSVFTSPSPPVRASSASPRRPKKGDEDYVKRPENAFILFRRKCSKDRADSPLPTEGDTPAPKKEKKPRQADLSKSISQKWKALPPEERAYWEGLAREKKREHEMRHPGYVYRPQRRNRAKQQEQQVEIVLPVGRRSASAPAPYQAIQIPNVYSGEGYYSEDPASLMPIIARLGVGNGNGGFDYLPSGSGPGTFETSDFLKSLIFPFPPPSILTTPPESSLFSPASSASGSAPPSPHTPPSALLMKGGAGCAGFHPSVFTAPTHASATTREMDAELEQATYAPYTSTWASSASPWGRTLEPGLAEGDFDIASIPEIGWGAASGVGVGGTGTQGEVPLELDAQKGELSELPFGPFDHGVELGGAHAMEDFEQWMHGHQTF